MQLFHDFLLDQYELFNYVYHAASLTSQRNKKSNNFAHISYNVTYL